MTSEDAPTLHQRAKRVIAQHGPADVNRLSEILLGELDPGEYQAALRVTLPLLVRQVMMDDRPSFGGPGPFSRPPLPTPSPLPVGPPPTPPQFRPAAGPAIANPGHGARHVTDPNPDRIRSRGLPGGAKYKEGWQRALDSNVVGADGSHKKLRDCTSSDLRAIAARLRQQAVRSNRRAAGYEALAALMEDNQAATVDDLSAEQKLEHLGRES